MLKITSNSNASETTLVLEGKLSDPWLSEFERACHEAQRDSSQLVVDLRDVLAVSIRAQELLHDMAQRGVKIRCPRGVFTKHLVSQIAGRFNICRQKRGKE